MIFIIADTTTPSPEGIGLVALLFILAVYFLPWLVALNRGHNSKTAIFFVNLIFGWTAVGWLIALIWSFTRTVTTARAKGLTSSHLSSRKLSLNDYASTRIPAQAARLR